MKILESTVIKRLIVLFHSMLVAYAILVTTLYGTETTGQDCMGFGNFALLAKRFTFLNSIRLKV